MKKIKLLLILPIMIACMGCQYSGKGVMVFGPPMLSLETRWDGTISANPRVLGFRIPTMFRFGLGSEGIEAVTKDMGPPAPKKGESN